MRITKRKTNGRPPSAGRNVLPVQVSSRKKEKCRVDHGSSGFLEFFLFVKKINQAGRTKLTVYLGVGTLETGRTEIMSILCTEIDTLHQLMIFAFAHRFHPQRFKLKNISRSLLIRIAATIRMPSPMNADVHGTFWSTTGRIILCISTIVKAIMILTCSKYLSLSSIDVSQIPPTTFFGAGIALRCIVTVFCIQITGILRLTGTI